MIMLLDCWRILMIWWIFVLHFIYIECRDWTFTCHIVKDEINSDTLSCSLKIYVNIFKSGPFFFFLSQFHFNFNPLMLLFLPTNVFLLCITYIVYIVHISITIRDTIIKLVHWRELIDLFNHVIFVCMLQARTSISISICPGLFVFKDFRRDVVFRFVDICGIFYHQFSTFFSKNVSTFVWIWNINYIFMYFKLIKIDKYFSDSIERKLAIMWGFVLPSVLFFRLTYRGQLTFKLTKVRIYFSLWDVEKPREKTTNALFTH